MKKLVLFLLLIVVPLGSQSRVLTKQDWIKFYLRPCQTVKHNYVCKQKLEKAISRMYYYLPMTEFQLNNRGLPNWLAVIPIIESNYTNNAVSMVGGEPFALGLWQISHYNVREYFNRSMLTKFSKKDILKYRMWKNPELNTYLAAWIIDGYKKKYTDWKHVLYAYNAGSKKVDSWINGKAELPKETENFYLQFLALQEIVKNEKKYGLKIERRMGYASYFIKNKVKILFDNAIN